MTDRERIDMPTVPQPRNVIYALFDIREPDVIRYVGLTSKKINDRFAGHKTAARSGKTWPVACWIRELGTEYIGCRVVEQCDSRVSLGFYEAYWIKKYRDLGHPLLNATTGGENPVFDEATLLKRKWNYRKPVISAELSARMRAEQSDGRRKGTNHARAKLNDRDVLEIRSWLEIGIQGIALMRSFGVSHATIMDIKKRRSWSHI